MNKVVLMGRLTRDPEIRYTGDQMCIAKFNLAVDRRKKGETDFLNCTAFGKVAELIEKHFAKGSKILVCGRIHNNNYTDKEGAKRFDVQIVVEELDFVDSKKKDEKPKADDFVPADDEELPFQ